MINSNLCETKLMLNSDFTNNRMLTVLCTCRTNSCKLTKCKKLTILSTLCEFKTCKKSNVTEHSGKTSDW